jgi:hypothetical protein
MDSGVCGRTLNVSFHEEDLVDGLTGVLGSLRISSIYSTE